LLPNASPSSETSALFRVAEAVQATGYKFVTITPASHAIVNARPFNKEARTLEDVIGWSRAFAPGVIPDRLFKLLLAAGLIERSGHL
jgi:release factor glutamine methyltransferase